MKLLSLAESVTGQNKPKPTLAITWPQRAANADPPEHESRLWWRLGCMGLLGSARDAESLADAIVRIITCVITNILLSRDRRVLSKDSKSLLEKQYDLYSSIRP